MAAVAPSMLYAVSRAYLQFDVRVALGVQYIHLHHVAEGLEGHQQIFLVDLRRHPLHQQDRRLAVRLGLEV
jgi:hypothetical protein